MIHILHLADLHLGRCHGYLRDRAAERRKEADGLLQRIVDRVLGDPIEVDVVVIAGDLFETYKPEEGLVGAVIGQLKRFVEAGRMVITLPGNHDELSYADCVYNRRRDHWPGYLVTSPTWAKITSLDTDDGPVHFYGIAYQAGITSDMLTTNLPLEPTGMHVALLHASVDLPGKDRAIQAGSKQLGELGVEYVALGHIHKSARIPIPGGLAVYPGLIEGSGFDDPGCGELTLVSLESGRPEVRTVALETRRIRTERVDLAGIEDADALAAHIRAMADPDLICRIELAGAAGFSVSAPYLAGEMGNLFYHLEIEAGYTTMDTAEVEAAAGEETVLGLVLRDLREREKSGDESERVVVRRAIRHVWEAFRSGSDHA